MRLNKLNSFCSAENYSVGDGFLAALLLMVNFFLLFISGLLLKNLDIYVGIYVNILLIILVLFFLYIRKQNISSIGISKQSLFYSTFVGFFVGALYFFLIRKHYDIAVLDGLSILTEHFIFVFIFNLLLVSITEELIFRGFVQTRMSFVIKSKLISLLLVAIIFSLSHVPFHAASQGVSLFEYVNHFGVFYFSKLIMQHIVLVLLYRAFNSIAGPITYHTMVNLAALTYENWNWSNSI